MAIDLYSWLTYRNSYLRRPSRIPWTALAAQLGASYRNRKDFKRYFLAGLRQVLVFYPAARVANATGRIDQTKRLKTVLYELTEAIRRLV